MDSLSSTLSASEWIDLFIIGMAVLLICNIVLILSLWIVSSKLSDIRELLTDDNESGQDNKHQN